MRSLRETKIEWCSNANSTIPRTQPYC